MTVKADQRYTSSQILFPVSIQQSVPLLCLHECWISSDLYEPVKEIKVVLIRQFRTLNPESDNNHSWPSSGDISGSDVTQI